MRQILQILLASAMFSIPVVSRAHGGEITTEGTAVVKVLPTVLRTQITIQERGTSAEDAMYKIVDNQRALHEYLLSLGANPRSILFGEVSEIAGVKSKFSSAPKKQPRSFGSTTVVERQEFVSFSVGGTAEWELKARNQQGLLVEFHVLKKRIIAAYNQVKNENPKLAASFSPPSFELAGRINNQKKMELLQAAFDNAKSNAAKLASVADAELGPLVKLNTTDNSRHVTNQPPTTEFNPQDNFWEATSNKPASVTFRINVSTIFSINHSAFKQPQPLSSVSQK